MTHPTLPAGALFDALADEYDEIRDEVGWDPWPHVEELLPLTPSDEGWIDLRVLDLGCGNGEVPARLAKAGARVLGLDASERMCEIAAGRAPSCTFMLHDLNARLPLPDSSFDVVLAMGCIEFVNDIPAALRDIARVARSTASLLLMVEICGDGYDGGHAHRVSLYDEWERVRLPFSRVEALAEEIFGADAEVSRAFAYTQDESGLPVMYARILRRGKHAKPIPGVV